MKRPALLIVLIGLLTGCGSRTATPDYTFQAVPFTDARFTDGFWAPRIETVSGRTIPFAFRKCEETGRIANFAVAAGLADTFVHVMEQYMTYPVDARVMDRWAEGLLQTVMEISPAAMSDEPDYDTMANFMLCATMGLNGFIAMGVPQDWATHMIGHELTALRCRSCCA